MRFDLPTPDQETQPFWDATQQGELLLQQCAACEHAYFYPRPFCPRCWSEDVSWLPASGRGSVYTWSVVHRNDLPPFPGRVPYVAAIVELEEGPRMMTNVVGCDLDALRVGMPVEVTFEEETDDITLPRFRPVGA
jgi:uncharacterized protein